MSRIAKGSLFDAGAGACRLGQRRQRKKQTEDDRLERLDENLGCGARADGDPLVAFPSEPHAVGHFVTLFDFDDAAWLQVVAFDEVQKRAVLVGHAADGHPGMNRAGQQRVVLTTVERAMRVGDGIAVRVELRPSQHLVDPIDEPFRNRVLEMFRFVMHLRPAHAHHFHQEQLDQAMPAQDHGGQLLAGRGQPDARVGLVFHEP